MTGSVSTIFAKAAALVVFLAAVAGATYGVMQVLGDVTVGASVAGHPVRDSLNATAGNAVSFAITLQNRGDAADTLRATLQGLGASGSSSAVLVPANSQRTVFVPFAIPAEAAVGAHELALRIENANGELLRERAAAVKVDVLASAAGFGPGSSADVLYVGRIADSGEVFNTNDPQLQALNFGKTQQYSYSSGGLLPVETVPQPTVVPGFYEGMLGMQPGEWRTFTFPPEQGYGPAESEEHIDRTEEIELNFSLPRRVDTVGRDVFDDYVVRTQQGDPASFGVGDVFVFIQEPNRWPYRIIEKSDTEVQYSIAVEVGQRYSLYPFWQNASIVDAVGTDEVTFRTEPTTAVGEKFTMLNHWPSMSEISALNETHVTIQHSPPEGLKYSPPAGQFQQRREFTVKELTADEIIVTSPSQNPLAGKSLTFDVYLARLSQ